MYGFFAGFSTIVCLTVAVMAILAVLVKYSLNLDEFSVMSGVIVGGATIVIAVGVFFVWLTN